MTNFRTGRAALAAMMLAATAGCGGDNDAASRGSAQAEAHPSLLYGRVTTTDGETHTGRLRFGGGEEATWSDYFYGRKDRNPWIEHVPEDERPSRRMSILGMKIGPRRVRDMDRPFLARFGDIAKLEADGRDLWVTMRSGTVHHLDRWEADDYADGIRIWDASGQVIDLGERDVRRIEFMASPATAAGPSSRLYGSVRTAQDEFTGPLQWGREGSVVMDDLTGEDAEGDEVSVPFATVRSVARQSAQSARVTLLDGREFVLTGGHRGAEQRGVYVDDARYGRVLVPWSAFVSADFAPAGAAGAAGAASTTGGASATGAAAGNTVVPGYGDFTPGRPLTGTVTTRDGTRHTGRLVFDLDESEDTETLDAPARGVHYTLPLSLVQSVMLPGGGTAAGDARVVLRNGQSLSLERADDLGPDNAGMLIFVDGGQLSEYVRWEDVVRIDFAAGAPTA